MIKILISCFLFIFVIRVYAQQTSYIQIKAEPDISVFLNDEFKGKTNVEYSGLIIEGLSAGSYKIKVVKDGFAPQTDVVVLTSGEVKIYQVKPFVPRYRITQSGNRQQQTIELMTGSLKIQSVPVEIQIEIPDLNIISSKTQDEWNIEDMPVGVHKLKFIWGNKVLYDTIRIEPQRYIHVFVNLLSGKIEVRSNEFYPQSKLDETKRLRMEKEEAEREQIEAEMRRATDIMNRTRNALADSKNGTSGISFDLGGRGIRNTPAPINIVEEEGRVVVEISVDRSGKVTQAIPGVKGSTTLNEDLLRASKEAALKTSFESNPNAPIVQKGTITFNFILK